MLATTFGKEDSFTVKIIYVNGMMIYEIKEMVDA